MKNLTSKLAMKLAFNSSEPVIKKSRAEQAGESLGLVIVEMIHLMYQNNTAANFWKGLMRILEKNRRER